MKNSWKLAIALAVALCLIMAFVACGRDGDGITYVTDDNGEIVTDTDGNPVTAADTNNNDIPDDSESDASSSSDTTTEADGSNIANAGADTDDSWGEIHRP